MNRGTAKVAVVAGAIVSMLGFNAGAAGAARATSPWTSGTVFIADQGQHTGFGALYDLPPGGSLGSLASGSVQDVATDAAGDVFWTDCNGFVAERTAGGSTVTLVSSGYSCPTGIAVDPAGNVYFGAFNGPAGQGLYKIPTTGPIALVTGAAGQLQSIAIDGNGDLWGAGGSNDLVLLPSGTNAPVIVPVPALAGNINAVRLDNNNNLYVSTAFIKNATQLPAGSVTPGATYGSGLQFTHGVVIDGSGNVFIGDPSLRQVVKVSGGSQSVVASGLDYPQGLVVWPPSAPASRAATTTTLTTTNSSTVSTQKTITVTATVSSGLNGLVEFTDNNGPLGNPVLTTASKATFTGTLSQGTHQITATFLGDASDAPSISNALLFTAVGVKTTTVLSTPGSTTVPGDQPVTLNAAVSGKGGTPTGSVVFSINGSSVGSASLDGTGHATFSVPLPPGTSKVTATYQGDSVYKASNSNKITFTTTPPYTPSLSTNVTYGPPNSSGAEKATIHIKVTGVKGNGAPTGSISADHSFACSALTPVAGTLVSKATCKHLVANGAFEDVQVSYSGDAVYDPASTFVSVSVGGGGG